MDKTRKIWQNGRGMGAPQLNEQARRKQRERFPECCSFNFPFFQFLHMSTRSDETGETLLEVRVTYKLTVFSNRNQYQRRCT